MKKKHMKKINALVASVLLLGTLTNDIALANTGVYIDPEEGVITTVVSDANYDGWDLTWEYNEDFYDLLIGISNGKESVAYEYDDNYNRIRKDYKNEEDVIFTYNENGDMVSEQKGNEVVQYVYAYDGESGSEKVAGFIYDGVEYTYNYSDYIITEILCNDIVVAKYVYDGKVNTDVLQPVDGEWVSNSSEDFLGNINHIRYKGDYYDAETGWYYDGRYVDPKYNRFIDGMNQRQAANMISKYGVEYEAEILLATNFFGLDMTAEEETSPLARADQFGTAGTIARVLYAESSYDVMDQAGVAWVVYNRSVAWKKTPYAIVTSGEFVGYQSPSYYNPDTTSKTWSSAVKEATYLSTGRTPTQKPSGFGSQKFFCSVKYFQPNISYDGINFYLKLDGKVKRICDIYIVGYGRITSYSQLNAVDFTKIRGNYNIFYNCYYE